MRHRLTDAVAGHSPPTRSLPTSVMPECAAPEPPVGVPTKDEALATAKQLFADWGYDVDSYQFDEPYADEWGASVNASLLLDGMKAPVMLSVGFGENGAVTYASGSLAEPQRGADYPTIGAAAGLERLKEQQNQYIGLDTVSARSATDDVSIDAAGRHVRPWPVAPDVPLRAGVGTCRVCAGAIPSRPSSRSTASRPTSRCCGPPTTRSGCCRPTRSARPTAASTR